MFKLSLVHISNITIHNFMEKQIIYKWSEVSDVEIKFRSWTVLPDVDLYHTFLVKNYVAPII